MGCSSSKLDDSPAVALCRERCGFLDEAVHQRYALAEAHLAYLHSLKSIGLSLHRFFDKDLHIPLQQPPSTSPLLKPDPQPSSAHSDSGSHLHFHSDSDSDGSLHHHSDTSSPLHHHHSTYQGYASADHQSLGFGGHMNMNYMRNQTTPSLLFEQRPMTPETLHMGESSSSAPPAAYYPYPPYANYQNPSSYSLYGYSNYGNVFSGSSSPPTMGAGPSTSKPPPPPPSPPRPSAWDFLNPFETFDKYYPPYTPSRDSREVREEEGIPDLEDEDYQQEEVVKEVHGDQKLVDGTSAGGGSYSKAAEDEQGKGNHVDSTYTSRPSASREPDPVQYEVLMVDKKVVNDGKRSGDQANVAGFKARGGFKADTDVLREIQVQFERASESGSELATMLEVGKLPYNRNHTAYQVSSKMLHAITPSLPFTSKSAVIEKADPASLDGDRELGLRSRNLSSTLHKLYLWEKKLYEEVKVEEKMRVLHERKTRKLKRLDEKGADFNKVDATRTLVRSLSTKIRIAIQVVDKISVKINKLRDEDLWPLLNEFIQGLSRMWKSMLECHHNQCQAIAEAKQLDAIAFGKHFSDTHLEATLQLEHELLNWILRFSCWVSAQKGYVRALNNWLMKCLLYVPEETPDGIVPFSPGRIGAPPVFVVCNQWSQSLNRISEKEVLDYMRDFATNVLQLWDRDKLEMRQRMITNKDMERKVKNLEREDQKIQKEIQALDKQMVLVSGDDSGFAVTRQVVYQSDATKSGSLQVGLQRIFEAMERFASNSMKVYEELLQRIEEDNLARDHEKVS